MPRKWGVLKAARKVLWTKAPEPEKSKPSVHWDTVETPSTSATAQGTDSAMVRSIGLLPCSMLRARGLSLAAGPELAACGLHLGCAAAQGFACGLLRLQQAPGFSGNLLSVSSKSVLHSTSMD